MSELMSMSETRSQPRCGNCGQAGHNRRTCTNNTEPSVPRRNRRLQDMQDERRDEMDRARWAREEEEQRLERLRQEHERVQAIAQARLNQHVQLADAERRRRTEQQVRANELRAREAAQRARENERRARENERRAAQAQRSNQGHIQINAPNMQISLHAGSNTITVHHHGVRQHHDSAAREQANRQRTPAVRAEIERLRQQAQTDENLRIMTQINNDLSERIARPMALTRRPEPRPKLIDSDFLKRVSELPIIRDKAVDTDDCPVCMETLGETGKTVLKCGHIVCQSCFLQQVLRATASEKVDSCACPVCRVNYLK